jgi:hypothetical protein
MRTLLAQKINLTKFLQYSLRCTIAGCLKPGGLRPGVRYGILYPVQSLSHVMCGSAPSSQFPPRPPLRPSAGHGQGGELKICCRIWAHIKFTVFCMGNSAIPVCIGNMHIRRSQFLKVVNQSENLICGSNPKTFLLTTFFKICSRFLQK